MKKLLYLFLGLSALILVGFALGGDALENFFSEEGSREFLGNLGENAGPLGALLLISDLVLPIPTTFLIAGMGSILGFAAACFWGWLGLSLAALLGYGLGRLGGTKLARRLMSEQEEAEARELFDRWGGLVIVLSRLLPILPEALSLLAGFSRMRPLPFCSAAVLGSLPPALIYAWIGHHGRETPMLALWSLVGVSALSWWLAMRLFKTTKL